MNQWKKPIEFGTFGGDDGIPYAKMGTGSKIMLIALGGPGNAISKGIGLKMYTRPMKPFREEYTQYFITRKSNLPERYRIQDMSVDYSDLIQKYFNGFVDIFIGISYGGMILTYFASEYGNLVGKIIITVAAHKGSPEGMLLDLEYAQLMNQGKTGKAMSKFALIFTQNRLWLPFLKGILFLIGWMSKESTSSKYKSDILIEGQAQQDFDATRSIQQLSQSIYVFGGDQDFYFPISLFYEMQSLSPYVNLEIFPKTGHNLFGKKKYVRKLKELLKSSE